MPRQALVSRSAEQRWITPIPGERVSIRVRSTEVGGAYAILEGVLSPQAGPPLHLHLHEEEVFIILEGSLRFVCEGKKFDAGAGDSVVIPKGTAHTWKNVTDEDARALVIFTPGGNETLFEEFVGKGPAGVEEVARRHGTLLVGPPLEVALNL